jgi:TolA-binding protein
MRRLCTVPLPVLLLALACAGNPDRRTLAELRDAEPDLSEVGVDNSLDQAMAAYRSFLEETPRSSLTPEAMRRLADLKLEKEYGILGGEKPIELPTPESNPAAGEEADLELPGGEEVAWAGPLEAIELYDQILASYPNYEHNDQILYQKARAYDELGRNDEAIGVIEDLIARFPHSRYLDEVQFRRGEYFFVRRRYLDAEEAYAAVTRLGVGSEYYELALYKLGWSLYKQQLHEEALDQYLALLDYKVSTGYDFDQIDDQGEGEDEGDERRIADTFRVISLSFSELGGSEKVKQYFATNGSRSYEDRIYSQLGEFYLEKLRYHDAAAAYRAFVDLHPLHRSSPHFSMRVVEIYDAGGFPKLVLESKKAFAASYSLQADYWRHFGVDDAPEVLSYLKSNLEDLANHYHALYQEDGLDEEGPAHFLEALHWYREYLASFPEDLEAPAVHYRLADLLLEHEDFGDAAREYERIAYEYPAHEKSAAAGYAAIYAHRENQKQAEGEEKAGVRLQAVASTLRFVDSFPEHEQAAVVLGAAVDDLYDIKEFERAIATGRRLIEAYPDADTSVRRSAWVVIAHASLETSDYVQAEGAYGRVLEMTPEDDESRQPIVDNLAAAIYKQGEQANLAGDHRAAADHFLRISQAAPTSDIRPAAEYDAGAALIRLEDWTAAAAVLDTFRKTHPEHELYREATKQIAMIYREQGDLSRAAGEYERVASEAEDPELRREALLLAGELYQDSELSDRALAVYQAYVDQFPEPLELAVETHWKIAEIHGKTGDDGSHRDQLRRIVAIDRSAGSKRTPRVRYLAARSALVLTKGLYDRFEEVKLVQPFEKHLQEKQHRMDAALDAFGKLVDYEVGEVTAAATFYMAEVYFEFSEALMESERPADLGPAELQDYELVLEEEAFPFEERAIAVHQKNLELMAAGVFNPWIEKSLEKLAAMMPGRYAKFEASTGPIESIDSYAYRAPVALNAPPEEEESDQAPDAQEPAAAPEPDSEAQESEEPTEGSLAAG